MRPGLACALAALVAGEALAQAAPEPIIVSPKLPEAAKPAEPRIPSKPRDSLYFTEDEIAHMREAMELFVRQSQGGGPGPENAVGSLSASPLEAEKRAAAAQAERPKTFTYPQFHLQTLVYHSEDDWLVQINGLRITPQNAEHNPLLQVLSIDRDKVSLLWAPGAMEHVGPAPEIGPLRVDRARRQVFFTLRPNQTFSSYAMQVVEGRVPPVTVPLAQAEPAPGSEPLVLEPPPRPGMPALPVEEKQNQEGLSGLLNSYKKLEKEKHP